MKILFLLATVLLESQAGENNNFLTAEDFERAENMIVEEPAPGQPYPFEDVGALSSFDRPTKRFSTRQAELTKLWNNAIVPYKIDPNFNDTEKMYIAKAIIMFRNMTCINWSPRNSEPDYVEFVKTSSATLCISKVGKQGGRQFIVLNNDTYCFNLRTILHEMMHTIGFHHEHQRNDRNNYVIINWATIATEDMANYVINPNGSDVGPYDFKSIMHYTKPQVEVLDDINEIKSGANFSALDVYKMQTIYGCRLIQTAEGHTWSSLQLFAILNFWRVLSLVFPPG